MRLPKLVALTVAACVGLAFYGLVGTALVAPEQIREVTQYKEPVRPTYVVPAEVAPIVRDLALDMNLVQYMKIEVVPDVSRCGGGNASNTAACMNNGTLIWPQAMFNTRPDQQYALFAHEYLHFVWAEIDPEYRNSLLPYLDSVWNTVPRFNKRLDTYTGLTSDDKYNEIQAYSCTEVADFKIPAPLLAYCTKYIPNRSVLPSYY